MIADAVYIQSVAVEHLPLPEDQKLWAEILSRVPDHVTAKIRRGLEVEPKLIIDFTRLIKEKTKALADRDTQRWQELLEEEKAILERYTI